MGLHISRYASIATGKCESTRWCQNELVLKGLLAYGKVQQPEVMLREKTGFRWKPVVLAYPALGPVA